VHGNDVIKVEGSVVEVLPKNIFRVELSNRHRLLAHLSRKLRLELIKIGLGDKVKLELSPYDLSKGMIIEN
jgi:translation initiation factor IF-1